MTDKRCILEAPLNTNGADGVSIQFTLHQHAPSLNLCNQLLLKALCAKVYDKVQRVK